MPENGAYSSLVKDSLVNSHAWKLDLINIVMIGLAEELPEHEENTRLHRLLGTLLSQNLSVNEKLNIIGNEYDIPMGIKDFREDVSVMCNLSQKIKKLELRQELRQELRLVKKKWCKNAQQGLYNRSDPLM